MKVKFATFLLLFGITLNAFAKGDGPMDLLLYSTTMGATNVLRSAFQIRHSDADPILVTTHAVSGTESITSKLSPQVRPDPLLGVVGIRLVSARGEVLSSDVCQIGFCSMMIPFQLAYIENGIEVGEQLLAAGNYYIQLLDSRNNVVRNHMFQINYSHTF